MASISDEYVIGNDILERDLGSNSSSAKESSSSNIKSSRCIVALDSEPITTHFRFVSRFVKIMLRKRGALTQTKFHRRADLRHGTEMRVLGTLSCCRMPFARYIWLLLSSDKANYSIPLSSNSTDIGSKLSSILSHCSISVGIIHWPVGVQPANR